MMFEKIKEDMISAMKARNQNMLIVLRSIISEVNKQVLDKQIELTDQLVVSVLNKALKQREESIICYEKAGRNDLLDIEKYEKEVILGYLPELLSEEETLLEIEKMCNRNSDKSFNNIIKCMKMAPNINIKIVPNLIKRYLGI